MELKKQTRKIRCEMGCKNFAEYTIVPSRMRQGVQICKECLGKLYTLIGGELVPKSVETVKPVRGGETFGKRK